MSDGGKGDSPRPFSVSQDVFARNWDAIFNTSKLKQRESCGKCYTCLENEVTEFGIPVVATRMILCPTCGNKRCPRATDHELACTNSNEPGQPGSNYK